MVSNKTFLLNKPHQKLMQNRCNNAIGAKIKIKLIYTNLSIINLLLIAHLLCSIQSNINILEYVHVNVCIICVNINLPARFLNLSLTSCTVYKVI